jgi:hypothetical protein
MDDEIGRWMATRKAATSMEIIQGKTMAAEATNRSIWRALGD